MKGFFGTVSLLLFIVIQGFAQLKSGLLQQNNNNHKEAIASFTKAIDEIKVKSEAYLTKIDNYYKMFDADSLPEGAVKPEPNPQLAKPYFHRAVSYDYMNMYKEAVADYNTAVKLDPSNRSAFKELAALQFRNNNKYEGCVALSRAFHLGDTASGEQFESRFCWDEAVVAYKEAGSKYRLRQYDQAMELVQHSIALFPDSSMYLALRGNIFLETGRADRAFKDFDRILKKSPKHAEGLLGRGRILLERKQYEAAFEDFNNVLRDTPEIVEAYLLRGDACVGMEKRESALYDYSQAQKKDPYDPEAYLKSGKLRKEMNDIKGACKDLKKAADLGSSEAETLAEGCK